jgi:hypothetical protein
LIPNSANHSGQPIRRVGRGRSTGASRGAAGRHRSAAAGHAGSRAAHRGHLVLPSSVDRKPAQRPMPYAMPASARCGTCSKPRSVAAAAERSTRVGRPAAHRNFGMTCSANDLTVCILDRPPSECPRGRMVMWRIPSAASDPIRFTTSAGVPTRLRSSTHSSGTRRPAVAAEEVRFQVSRISATSLGS